MRNITLGSSDIGLQEINNKMPSYYLRKLRDRISPRLVGARAPSKPVDPGKRRRTSRSEAGIFTDTPNSTQQDTNIGLENADVFNGLNDSTLQRISDLETSPNSHFVEPTGNVDTVDESSDASNHRRMSEEIYDSPDAVNECIRRILVDMDRLRSLEHDTNWKHNISKYYNAVMDAQESLTRSVVLNGMSEQFRDMLLDISTEANKIKDDLMNSGTGDSAMGARPRSATLEPTPHPRTFSSTYAQRLEARRVADSYVPNHNQRSQAGTNESMPGFNGWSQDSDTQTVINRFAERLSEVESTIDKAKIELKTNTETIMTEAQSLKRQVSINRKGNESNKEAFGKDIARVETSIMNIASRLTKVEGPVASIGGLEVRLGNVEGEVKEVTRLVKAVPRDIDNAINGLRQELISRFSRDPPGDPHHDAIMGARGGDRPPDMEIAELKRHVTNEQIKMEDRMINVEDKVKAIEFDLQGLASSTKSVRKGMVDMRKDIDSTLHVRQTSTPIQHVQVSHGDSTMSQLGNQFSRRTLERMLVQINKIIDDHPLTEVDIFTLKKMHSIETPKLQKLTDGFSKRIQECCKADAIDDELYERCLSATDAADSWITSIEELCDRMDIHAINNDKHKATSDLMRFTGDHRQTIYEFIEDFETEYIGIGNSKSRANIMYKKYLSQFITTKTLSLSNDYAALKAWLIDTFGDIVTVVDLLVTSLEACKTPSNDSTSDRLEFFLAISNVFVRLDRLAETPGVSSGKLEEHISSRTIMGRLFAILPTNDEMRLIELLRENNLETRKIQGPYALDVFKGFITARLDDLQRIAEKGTRRPPASNKQKPKTNGASGSRLDYGSSSESDDNFGHKSTMGAATASPQWWRSGLSFPCPMVGHDHELGTCVDFFTLKPTQRKARLNKANRRLCWSCLKPATKCDRKCVQNVTMSEVIKCKDCAPYAASKGFACLSVLFCTNIEHNKSRPPPSLLIKELKKYLKVMSSGITDKTIVYVNSTFLSVNTAKTSDNRNSKTRRPDPQDDCTPIDTQSGTRDHNGNISIQKESRDDAFFLMQWIKIGSSDCMVFFDRGSNVNLIDGQLAESEKLEVISQKSSTLKVVGGEDVSTEYGTYKLTLGSNKSGKYHEIVCHGMPQVTTSFNKYPLNEINQEVRSNTSIIGECEPLPAAVGGSVAHLLIGIKDVDLDPTHLATLTSGVGVYRSPFKDIYGSDICYAGPHPSFSKTNCLSGNQATLASMSAHIQENRDSIYEAIMAEKSVSTDIHLATKRPLTTELNPSPLSSQDFIVLGCKVEEAQLEELGPKVNESYSTLVGQAGEAITQLQERCKEDHPDMVDPLTKSKYVDVSTLVGQTGEAVTQLQEGCREDHPDMVDPLTKSRYVDVCGPGANSKEQREAQIKDSKATLGKGGFKMNFIVCSREPPCEEDSGDGETVKLLGYKYAGRNSAINCSQECSPVIPERIGHYDMIILANSQQMDGGWQIPNIAYLYMLSQVQISLNQALRNGKRKLPEVDSPSLTLDDIIIFFYLLQYGITVALRVILRNLVMVDSCLCNNTIQKNTNLPQCRIDRLTPKNDSSLSPPEFPKGTYAVQFIISLSFCSVEIAWDRIKYCTNKVLKVTTNNMMIRGLTLCDLFHSVRSQGHQIACFHFHSPANSIQCLLVFIILNSSFSRPTAPSHVFDAFSPRHFVGIVSACASSSRNSRQKDTNELLFDLRSLAWGKDGSSAVLTPTLLPNYIAGVKHRWSDTWHMDKFLYNCKRMGKGYTLDKVFVPKELTKGKMLCNKGPVLDMLYVLKKHRVCWSFDENGQETNVFQDFQNVRALGYELLDKCVVKEIIVGVTSPDTIRNIHIWAMECYRNDQLFAPTGAMSFDVEEFRMHLNDHTKLTKGTLQGDSLTFSTKFKKGDPSDQFPVKFVFGNGSTWALMVSIEVTYHEGDAATVNRICFQDELIDLLRALPLLVGLGVRTDAVPLENLVRCNTNYKDFRLAGFYDVAVPAVLAGWNAPNTHMSIMSVLLTGGVLNKNVSRGDGNWGRPWAKITKALQVYCLGDVKFGHQAMVIIFYLLIQDLFPDPDIVLSFTRSNAVDFGRWFSSWLNNSIVGCEVDNDALKNAVTREDLIRSIRYRHRDGVRSRQAPSRILVFCKMLGFWPSVMFGGPRFLHNVRRHFIKQCDVLTKSDAFGWSTIMPYEITPEMCEAATYAVPGLSKIDWYVPTEVVFGLALHPALAPKSVAITPASELTMELIKEMRVSSKRIIREMIYEWARLNLDQLDDFFVRVPNHPHFSQWLGSYYREIRQIHKRVTGLPAKRVESIDAQIVKSVKSKLINAEKACAFAEQQVKDHRTRVAFLRQSLLDDDTFTSVLTFRGQYPELTGRKVLAVKRSRVDAAAPEFSAEAPIAGPNCSPARCMETNEYPTPGRHPKAPKAKKRKKFGITDMSDGALGNYLDLQLDLNNAEIFSRFDQSDMSD